MSHKKLKDPVIDEVMHGMPCVRDTPPIMPLGCEFEFWGGAVAIDSGLVIWDVCTNSQSASPVSERRELSLRSRRALADYMIKLWEKFAEQPNEEEAIKEVAT